MNLPNKLTTIRIILIPIILILFFNPVFTQPVTLLGKSFTLNELIIVALFIIGSITDFLDGYLARKNKLITTFGKFMDPIADKLLVNTMFFLLVVSGKIHPLFFVLMFFRDVIVDGIRMLAASSGTVIAAGNLGKAKTVLQMFSIILISLKNIGFDQLNIPMGQILLVLATIVSVVSGLQYLWDAKDLILESI